MIRSGDAIIDAAERHRFLDAYNAKHELVADGDTRMVLYVGENDWPLPIPLVHTNGVWTFDSKRGAEEIVNRRIGRDEIEAIRVCLAYVDAQQAYFDLSQQATGKAVYAQRLVSTAHNYDGLYWPSAANIPASPFAALVAQAQEEGYPGELVAGKPGRVIPRWLRCGCERLCTEPVTVKQHGVRAPPKFPEQVARPGYCRSMPAGIQTNAGRRR